MHPTSSFLAILALTPFLAVSAAPINTDGGALFIRGADADPVNYSDAYKMFVHIIFPSKKGSYSYSTGVTSSMVPRSGKGQTSKSAAEN